MSGVEDYRTVDGRWASEVIGERVTSGDLGAGSLQRRPRMTGHRLARVDYPRSTLRYAWCTCGAMARVLGFDSADAWHGAVGWARLHQRWPDVPPAELGKRAGWPWIRPSVRKS